MGTNYYARKIPTEKDKDRIFNLIKNNDWDYASNEFSQVHIGKSSYGWQFLFDHNNYEYYKDKASLVKFLEDRVIEDEYGDTISNDDFWKMVEKKKDGWDYETYYNEWDEIHPGLDKPTGIFRGKDIFIDGLRFSDRTDFS